MAKKEKTISKNGASNGVAPEAKASKKGSKDRIKRDKKVWHGHIEEDLGAELAALGLRIKDITGDGNCFFRALGDQLQGDERQHVELRQRVVAYMAAREEEFAPFVEDDESFGTYIARMKKDGVWAGYMEVVAASRCLGANLTIYQAGQPRWRVVHHPEDAAPMLHLSYHDGQHYNSVRAADDFGTGPPAAIVLRGDGMLARPPPRPAGAGSWDERDEARVARSTACSDMGLVRRALEGAGGDVDAAIEKVIEALAAAADQEGPEEEHSTADAGKASPAGHGEADAGVRSGAGAEMFDTHSRPADLGTAAAAELQGAGTAGDDGAATSGVAVVEGGCSGHSDEVHAGDGAEGGTAASAAGSGPPPDGAVGDAGPSKAGGRRGHRGAAEPGAGAGAAAAAAPSKAPSNNKRCPCGSGKKYKACCGPAAAAAARRKGAAAAAVEEAAADAGERTLVAQVAALVI